MNPGTIDEWKSDTLDDEEWAPVLSECCSIPLRSSATGFAMRSVGVEVVGACSGAGTITARVYLRGSRSTDARDTGYPGETCYCTLTFEETTYERETGTITDPVAAPPIPVYADPGDAIESEPPTCGMANLEIIAISADGIALYIDTVRLIEGEP